MAWTTSDRVMAVRRRSAVVDVAVAALDGWRRHISGRNTTVISFFGFLSIFPLLIVATTILGFVLQDNEDLQDRIIDGAFADIPVLGEQLAEDPTSLSGSVWVLIVGLIGALWSATKAFVAVQMAQDDTWEVSVDDRAMMPIQRGRALLGIVFIGAAQIAGLVAAAFVSAADLPLGGVLLLLAATVAINIAVIAAMYRFLTSASPTWRDVWPGAVGAGVAYTLLQQFGTLIVKEISENASDTYGNFALVLGLVTWLGLLAIVSVLGAEVNAALVAHREGSLARVQVGN
jgi:membrane protein